MATLGQDSPYPGAVSTPRPSDRTCDTHVHVFDQARFPFVECRQFTPGYAGVDCLRQHLRRIDANRVVLIQPSVYGHDHRCMVDALHALGGAGRGVAVLAPATPLHLIRILDACGVRATRINLVVNGIVDPSVAEAAISLALQQIPAHWHIQLHVNLAVLSQLSWLIRRSSCHFVLDHMGLPQDPSTPDQPEWQEVVALCTAGKLSVKLSAPYLSTEKNSDLRPMVASLMRANPQSMVWGTNWPHTQGTARPAICNLNRIETFRQVNDVDWRMQCLQWLQEANLPISTFEDNAERLYGF